MAKTPKGFRLHIGLYGRRNVGKSSILNALTSQQVSIVSDIAGTTTDPVEKPMEFLPIGPVLFIDTAGIDDSGALGRKRVSRTRAILDRTDVAILVVPAGEWTSFEDQILKELQHREIPVILVFNKSDLSSAGEQCCRQLFDQGIALVHAVATRGEGMIDLRQALIQVTPDSFLQAPPIVADLVPPGNLAILVTPIDIEAPKGRLILPQVQSIRDLLDGNALSMIVKESELSTALDLLKTPPVLVVTDSQAFLKVAADTPDFIVMTSFSILFARAKGDLEAFVEGAMAIETLRPGDHVLIAEACTHHPVDEDIGRVKIPNWLTEYVGGKLEFSFVRGHDFPGDLRPYQLVIHCGACMWNRREMLSRQLFARKSGVPMANYGLTIAYTLGIFDRALSPFPAARQIYLDRANQKNRNS
ncbi:[FeFe] hydrogenase H-cluster maturation GTPase HydF [Desulfosalsimonas propionicica]|uniref:[FeFe] hydrogenase H-cluster maturation GTPase HydF n=1 Tax=Desulfosalsimonas propionicica TaxID=332175 RepID=A0A7W0CAP1_9BACT|nr:[FeFe] hydrogenase H-cluster maturation GTPase HydF [Desulfosalsimonas propionicica]MBA2882269.1 [FeFe] hydrogenase H-cluster maturation GTPase HydF [Desulfosalsimonas propionicica]